MISSNPIKRRLIIGIPAVLLLAAIVLFSVRGVILRKVLRVASGKLREHHYIAHFDGARFSGVRSVFIREIFVQDEKNKNEIGLDSLEVRIRLVPLIFKNIRVRRIACRALHIRVEPGWGSGVVARPKEQQVDLFSEIAGTDLAATAHNYIRRFFRYLPAKADIGQMDARVLYAGKTTLIELNELHLSQGHFTGTFLFSGEGKSDRIPLQGRLDRSSHVVELALKNTGEPLLPVPVIRDKYGLEAGFDSISFRVDLSEYASDRVSLKGSFFFTGFELAGERLSTTGISIDQVNASYLLHITPHTVELDSSSSGELNRIRILPYLKADMETGPRIILKIRPVTWDAGDFYHALPDGMFTSLIGLKAEGRLQYSMNFDVDLRNPDSLKFESSLKSGDLRIIAFGNDDYRKLNGSFRHEVYERGRLKTTFIVGSENPDFVPFGEISPFVRAAVMTSEDGSFFFHNGFNTEAFRESIVTNIKEKRFARGGSTITMQLVKNVFLTRNKTIARKIEEALIVWLIENRNLVSKQRMYEVYLNLIEWGPGIYGINQASHYYFNKKPAALNLQESIYLASIVPHPKWYKFTFETNGVPKPFFNNYFHRMEQLMVRKQFIAETDTIGAVSAVMLTGPASEAFAVADTVRADSLILQELEIIPASVE